LPNEGEEDDDVVDEEVEHYNRFCCGAEGMRRKKRQPTEKRTQNKTNKVAAKAPEPLRMQHAAEPLLIQHNLLANSA
jgi:hypothetical protein